MTYLSLALGIPAYVAGVLLFAWAAGEMITSPVWWFITVSAFLVVYSTAYWTAFVVGLLAATGFIDKMFLPDSHHGHHDDHDHDEHEEPVADHLGRVAPVDPFAWRLSIDAKPQLAVAGNRKGKRS